jgi:sugar (pentulose or hexulose) kinase
LLSQETEATSRGAAALALKAAGLIQNESDLPDPDTETIEPKAAHHSVYQHALARQQALYEATLRL